MYMYVYIKLLTKTTEMTNEGASIKSSCLWSSSAWYSQKW